MKSSNLDVIIEELNGQRFGIWEGADLRLKRQLGELTEEALEEGCDYDAIAGKASRLMDAYLGVMRLLRRPVRGEVENYRALMTLLNEKGLATKERAGQPEPTESEWKKTLSLLMEPTSSARLNYRMRFHSRRGADVEGGEAEVDVEREAMWQRLYDDYHDSRKS